MSANVLKIKNVESRRQKQSRRNPDCQPISLLAFLRAENCKLRDTVAQLEQHTLALREALQKA